MKSSPCDHTHYKYTRFTQYIMLCFFYYILIHPHPLLPQYNAQSQTNNAATLTQPHINAIIIEGNHQVPTAAIRNRIPYQIGEIFSQTKTAHLIKNVYNLGDLPFGIGYFNSVRVELEHISNNLVNVYVIVDEKYQLEKVIVEGNKSVSDKEIKQKIDFLEIPVINEYDAEKYIAIIRGLYKEKSYHDVLITPVLDITDNQAILTLQIEENKQSVIKKVRFTGNYNISSKTLRSTIFTREDWLLGFLDRAGTYHPDAIEADKYLLENYYQSHGFYHAKVVNVDVEVDEFSKEICVIFHINEGAFYLVSAINAPGNDIIPECDILLQLPLKPGLPYSKEKIRESMEIMRLMWGEHGYIYADIVPSIQPNEEDNTVEITFYSELGPCVYLNRVNIFGNEKTLDKVIRRQLSLKEGELLTTKKMDDSKSKVELLGYFDARDGVNWRIHRISDNLADLDLLVNEVKTGQFYGQIGFGGSPTDFQSPTESFNVSAGVTESNLFGLGVHVDLKTELSKRFRTFEFSLVEPWLFDRPIHFSVDLVFKRSRYDDVGSTENEIVEKLRGGNLSFGFFSERLNDTRFISRLGINNLNYENRPVARFPDPDVRREFQSILDKRFAVGTFAWIEAEASNDFRNHPVHPSRGYQWYYLSKIGIPAKANFLLDSPLDTNQLEFGFFKQDIDYSWYTPLIGERDLVFGFHTHLGLVVQFKNHTVPFRELYHIGGPASVRGFLFGEIGPSFLGNESLGGSKAFWMNAELVFPLTPDFSVKGAVFYDGGAGWDTPDAELIAPSRLLKNSFNYRHAVGIGIRMLRPTPVKFDWGFKLDRKKGESATQAHLTMYHNF